MEDCIYIYRIRKENEERLTQDTYILYTNIYIEHHIDISVAHYDCIYIYRLRYVTTWKIVYIYIE